MPEILPRNLSDSSFPAIDHIKAETARLLTIAADRMEKQGWKRGGGASQTGRACLSNHLSFAVQENQELAPVHAYASNILRLTISTQVILAPDGRQLYYLGGIENWNDFQCNDEDDALRIYRLAAKYAQEPPLPLPSPSPGE